MKIIALKSFCGTLTMAQGEVREYGNEAVLSDLLKAGYIKELSKEIPTEVPAEQTVKEVPAAQPAKRKAVKKNESK